MGFEKGVVHTLELLLDEYAQTRQHMRELTELVQLCINQIDNFVNIGQGMQRKLDQIARDKEQGEAHGDNTQ
jgi:hypothetical protein